MKSLYLGTTVVHPNEPCWGLSEVNLQSPGSRGFHRYQLIFVIRNDKVYEYRKDMGLAKNFSAIQFRIPGGFRQPDGRFDIVHTVAELQGIADDMRHDTPPQHEPSDLIGQYHDHIEKRKKERKGQIAYAINGLRNN